MTAADDGVRILLGAYVLGGLDAVDRRQVKDHLLTARSVAPSWSI